MINQAIINDYRILIVGLISNCEVGVRKSIYTLSKAFEGFQDIQYLVIESDSSDNTFQSLQELSKTINGFRFISLGNLKDSYPLRTDRIAFCRNKYLNEINNNPLYKNIDYVVMADLDDVNTILTQSAVHSCWQRHDWDVCTANQKYAYYDIYALRHNLWQTNDCYEQYRYLKKYGISKEKALFAALYAKMIHIKDDGEWIEVDSAFGGLAIYKIDTLKNAYYIGLDKNGNEICEHVPFHAQLKQQNFKIYINPKLINSSRFYDSLNRFIIFIIIKRVFKNFLARPFNDLRSFIRKNSIGNTKS